MEGNMDPSDREYKNEDITVYWKPGKCIHATTCYRELIDVFNPRKRPWVNMKGAPTERIIEVVKKCPTQALSFSYNDDKKNAELTQPGEHETEDKQPAKIQVMKDGPLVVEGYFKITGTEGQQMKSLKITSFCRCGNSRSMPFCDGSHRIAGFKS
ncbi:MAG: (4Fe-4S)-binding protein [Bacteroidales bacterium]